MNSDDRRILFWVAAAAFVGTIVGGVIWILATS